MRYVLRALVGVLAVIGGMLVIVGVVLGLWGMRTRQASLPPRIMLSLNLDDGVVEAAPSSLLAGLTGSQGLPLSTLAATLDRAATDSRVAGLVARLDGTGPGIAQAQEIRDAILAFRKAGKHTTLFTTELGEFGDGSVATYLASAFDDIWLQPSGDVGLAGFMAETPFIRGTFDLLGVEAQFGGRWQYKSAIDTFNRTAMSPENRQNLQDLLDSWTAQVQGGIADARHLAPAQVRELMDRGPFLAEEAQKAGLVDHLGYWDEVVKQTTNGGIKLVALSDYSGRLPEIPGAVKVALIVGSGDVVQGGGSESPLSQNNEMSASKLERAFRDAVADPSIKAILFRIDSPGGSYTAADSIRRDVESARAAGKPVVVSMGNLAASGGYFAAMAADRIVAEPGTITGSIGVFAGKFVLSGLWKKLGVSWDRATVGTNASIWDQDQEFTPAEWDRLNAMLDQVYADFTGKAEAARNIKPDDMDKIARGRIWSGADALHLHLVDANGGYATAFTQIRELARLPSQMPLELVSFPKPKKPLDVALQFARTGKLPEAALGVSLGIGADSSLSPILSKLAPLAALVPHDGDDILRMQPMVAH